MATVTGYTNSQGKFKIELPNGEYSYTIEKDGYKKTDPEAIVVASRNQLIGRDINENKYYSVTFTTGVPGATVKLGSLTATTDASGNVTFTQVTAGEYSWEVSKVRYKTIAGTVNVTGVTNIPVTMIQINTVTIRTKSKGSGDPIPDINVTFDGVTKQTNSSGNAVFTEVEPGERPYTIPSQGVYEGTSGSIIVTNQDIIREVELEGEYAVTFKVNGIENTLLEGATVNVSGKSGVTNEQGEVVIQLQNGTNHTYSISAPNYQSKSGTTGILTENKTITERVTYLTNVVFSVKQNTASGAGVSGVQITIGTEKINTDGLGVASIRLAPGTYTASYSKTGFDTSGNTNFTVTESASNQNIQKVILGIYSLILNVKRAGQNQTGKVVTLTPASGVAKTATTNASGNAIFESVVYGTYTSSVAKGEFHAAYSSSVVADANKTVNVNLTPLYTVSFVLTPTPTEAVDIVCTGAKNQTISTNAEGVGSITDVPEGFLEYNIAETSKYAAVKKILTIPTSPTETVITELVTLAEKVIYTVYSNQGTPNVFFDGVLVGRISSGKLEVPRVKATSPIEVTLTETSSRTPDYTYNEGMSDLELNLQGTTIGGYLGWQSALEYYIGINSGVVAQKLSGSNPQQAGAKMRGNWNTIKTTYTYSNNTSGSIPVSQTQISLNYGENRSDEVTSSVPVEEFVTSSSAPGLATWLTPGSVTAPVDGNTYRTWDTTLTAPHTAIYIEFSFVYGGREWIRRASIYKNA